MRHLQVQAIRKAALGLDPRDYQDSMKQLENEVMKLKAVYDDEINKLRLTCRVRIPVILT